MCGKYKSDYRERSNDVRDLFDTEPKVQKVVIDVEWVIWKAIPKVFENVKSQEQTTMSKASTTC